VPDGAGARNTDEAGAMTRLRGDEVVSMNMWGFSPPVFGQLEDSFARFLTESGGSARAEFYIPNAIGGLLAEGKARVRVLHTQDAWFGVTYRADHARVVECIDGLVKSGAYPEGLWA
jgi:hypothetical protein